MHGQPGVGHFGVNKTLKRVRQEFYWHTCRRDVESFCRRCDACTAKKGPTGRSHAPLQQRLVGCPMDRVAVDVLGPFPQTPRGNRFVVVAMDYFIKWPEAYAVPNQEAGTVAEVLLEGLFARFGVPSEMHTDQGRNFESRVFSEFCQQLGSKGLGSSVTDGPACQSECRAGDHWMYASSPYAGQRIANPILPIDGSTTRCTKGPNGLEYVHQLQDRLQSAHDFARCQAMQAGIRQKRAYDHHCSGRDFNDGELVWIYSPKRKKGRSPKLDCAWVGPCCVVKRLGESVYHVRKRPGGQAVVLHRDRMAPYVGDCNLSRGEDNGRPLGRPTLRTKELETQCRTRGGKPQRAVKRVTL
ncbi:interleukin-1 receptor accessory protein-like 1-A [Pimephales promelas]|nr:interleukin-1 receptor accessory protein-like 1-A [Pimephales promelas]